MRQMFLVSVLILGALLVPTSAWADCNTLRDTAETVATAGDIPGLRSTVDSAEQGKCGTVFIAAMKRKLAIAYSKAAQKRLADGDVSPALETFLTEGLHAWPLWSLEAMLGDLAHQRKDYVTSAQAYMDTLELINDPSVTPTAPTAEAINHVKKRAEEARTLAVAFVPAPVSRSGGVSASLSVSVRGFRPEAVTVPVRYVFREAKMTSDGEKAADELLEALTKQNLPHIKLIGHTDPRGSATVNDKLSQDRADNLKIYLETHGYHGRIDTASMGSRHPVKIDDPRAYTEEEQYQLQRRVEFVQVQ